MKTAIYIEDGVVQLVLTPESDFEKSSIKSFSDRPTSTKIFNGAFYDCRGGWVRQKEFTHVMGYGGKSDDASLIMRIDSKGTEQV